jgi:hypothetical protein
MERIGQYRAEGGVKDGGNLVARLLERRNCRGKHCSFH